jgi:acyl-coenzyme A thioesterase PaaI-like protein
MKSSKKKLWHFLKRNSTKFEHCTIESVTSKAAVVYYHVDQRHQRPGGTISGPTMMTLADFALYIAILGEIGIVGLAVTTNFNINF